MSICCNIKTLFCSLSLFYAATASGANQTEAVSRISCGDELPFEISIKLADFQLPFGFHSGVMGEHEGKWLFLAGRSNGLHGFEDDSSNFPPSQQNTEVIVVDFVNETVYTRSLLDKKSGLSQCQVDLLSVTSPQFYQSGKTLYMTGGYGVITATGQFNTKNALTAIDLPGLIDWVVNCSPKDYASNYIRQIFHPIFQVTGGFMSQIGKGPTLLIYGQNFDGFYFEGGNGIYTNQVRRFQIYDDGSLLAASILPSLPTKPDENYRRRDLNVVPALKYNDGCFNSIFVALSGVFTLSGGAWTVPVVIDREGNSTMADPNSCTFKQGMNNYVCPAVNLYSKKHKKNYTTLLGGISFGYFDDGIFKTDSELPFINQVTTVTLDRDGEFKQFLMDASYPVILSTSQNPGNELLFGAAAEFIPAAGLKTFRNGVIKLDELENGRSKLAGYVIGGIQSTLPNTNTMADSTASPYIFKVYIHSPH